MIDSPDDPSQFGQFVPAPYLPPGLSPRPRVLFRTKRKMLVHEGRVRRLRGRENLEVWKRFSHDFITTPGDVPVETASYLLDRGFHKDKALLYGLPNENVDDYLSDLQVALLPFANGRDGPIIENRQLFYQTFRDVLPCAQHLCLVVRGKVVWLSGSGAGELDGGRLLAMPIDQRAGESFVVDPAGRRLCRPHGDQPYIELEPSLAAEPTDLVVVRDPEAGRRSERLRLVLIRDPRRHAPVLVGSALGMSTPRSGAFATLAAGAISVGVDVESGLMRQAVELAGGAPVTVEAHPDDGAPFAGRAVRHWWPVVEMAQAALLRLPLFSMVEFDFAVSGERPILMDATARISASEFQVHGPLMGGQVARRFLREYGL